jgi:serralysin
MKRNQKQIIPAIRATRKMMGSKRKASPIRQTNRVLTFALGFLLLASNLSSRAYHSAQEIETQAQAGALDPSFGNGGKVFTDFSGQEDDAFAMVVQPDDKIIVGGSAFIAGNNDFALSRYNADGSLDSGFGSNGKVTTDFFTYIDTIYAIALQADGKIVAGGNARHLLPVNRSDFALVRYNANGSLDSTFGAGGKATANFFGDFDAITGLALQADGKIVAVGIAGNQAGFNNFALARFNTDGSLDPSFGSNGKVSNTIADILDQANAVAIQPDNKIVVAGYSKLTNAGPFEAAVLRYNANGSLDTSFGTNGFVLTNLSSSFSTIAAIALQADGKIVAAGEAYATIGLDTADFTLVRYNANGTLDSGFNGGALLTDQTPIPADGDPVALAHPLGAIITDFYAHADEGFALRIQADGKLLVAGRSQLSAADESSDFAIARYNANGDLDTSFDTNGKASTDFAGHFDSARAIALQSDGKIVLAGRAAKTGITNGDFALARYTVEPNFGLSVSQAPIIAERGTKVPVTILINRTGGFSGNITVTPPDASALHIQPKPPDPIGTTDPSVKFKLKVKGSAPTGLQQLVFTGRDDTGRTRTTTVTLNIQ